jgi:hypothetical protein
MITKQILLYIVYCILCIYFESSGHGATLRRSIKHIVTIFIVISYIKGPGMEPHNIPEIPGRLEVQGSNPLQERIFNDSACREPQQFVAKNEDDPTVTAAPKYSATNGELLYASGRSLLT